MESDLKAIYETYRHRIHAYIGRLVGEAESEDVTQEVFTKVNQSLKDFRGGSRLSTWIYRIATNAALDRIRKRGRSGVELSIDDILETEENNGISTVEQEPSTEQRVIRQEMNGCIRQIIETLPEAYRIVIVLSELEGLKDAEMAEVLGLSLQAAKIRLHRARTRLKKELKTACIFYRDERNEFACDRKNSFITSDDINSIFKRQS